MSRVHSCWSSQKTFRLVMSSVIPEWSKVHMSMYGMPRPITVSAGSSRTMRLKLASSMRITMFWFARKGVGSGVVHMGGVAVEGACGGGGENGEVWATRGSEGPREGRAECVVDAGARGARGAEKEKEHLGPVATPESRRAKI